MNGLTLADPTTQRMPGAWSGVCVPRRARADCRAARVSRAGRGPIHRQTFTGVPVRVVDRAASATLRWRRCALPLVVILLATVSVAAPTASASTRVRLDTSTNPDTLYYEESPGSDEQSDLFMLGYTDGITLYENSGVTIEAPAVADCSGGGANVSCSLVGRVLQVNLGDLADHVLPQTPYGVRIDGGAGADELIGSSLTGNSDPDVINGGDGNDTIDSKLNADVVNGGPGDDLLIGPDGFDDGEVLAGGAGTDTVDYGLSYSLEGLLLSMDGVKQLGEKHSIGADVENVIGTPYADTIVGNAADNVLDGGPGSCSDSIAGGSGKDTVSFATHTSGVNASLEGGGSGPSCIAAEADQIAPDIESIRGSPYDDVLVGNDLENTLDGGAGDDRLDPRLGPDTVLGGLGVDSADYGSRADPVELTLDGAANDGNADDGPTNGRDLIANDVEGLIGGSADDSLVGNGQDNVLDGGAGDDQLEGLGGVDTADYSTRSSDIFVDLADMAATDGDATEFDSVGPDVEDVLGGDGSDLLIGAAPANALSAGAGDDVLVGAGGADALSGGDGADLASYAEHSAGVVADLDGEAGDDGAPGEGDTLGSDLEALVGGAGSDQLGGNAEANFFDGGPGADVFTGGPGFDLVSYATRSTGVVADPDGAVDDDGEPGEGDTIGLDIEDLEGGDGADTLTGNAAENFIYGGPGFDRLDGASGEDALFGDDGDDELVTRDDEGDLADCGLGDDLARPDEFDELVGCERRDDVVVPGGTSVAPVAPLAPAVTAPPRRARRLTRRLARALRRGIGVEIGSSEPSTLTAQLLVTRRLGRRLHLRRRLVGRGVARVVTSETKLVVRFTATARRRLANRHFLRATLHVAAKDPVGNTRKMTLAVSLR